MTAHPPGWEGLLAADERILWQGQPEPGILWRDLLSPLTLMGLFFLAFSTAWLFGVSVMLGNMPDRPLLWPFRVFFPLIGGFFWLVGAYLLIGRLFWEARQRRRTWYTLTDRAAFIATQGPGRRALQRYGTEDMRAIELVDTTPGTVWFAQELIRYTTGNRRHGGVRRQQIHRKRTGFRHIAEARHVFALMAPHRAAVTG
ncbi:hypothetical protein [Pararhodobacter zhoushanensis]|uniref:Aspartate carbamoyltransferase catalytic subunit n=1 Tax=Pararhodobacter zhoushanensis TaxID=2479545 RepID=A0ABT3H3I9_9RHOB|nr:hypothetical protein [Pararhodobacter zhoushanensis]MCW1934371.1 hypothetical protein [Pararhodobacter zhoushanensis]